MNSRKEEDITNGTNDEKGSSSNPPSSSSSWSRLKDPRIVRVSRAFGGKDRHSKVCTIKGLRDRRVRLSVPTAIQLYDLQERLGLNQPSKVVDWLLDVAKNEIHELPPLQIPSDGNLIIDQSLVRSILASQSVGKQLIGSNISNPWISDNNNTLLGNKSKDDDVFHQTESSTHERIQDFRDAGVSLMDNSSISEQQFMRWDSSALSLAQSRNSGITNEDVHHHHHQNQSFNVLPFMTSAETQVLVYQQQQQQQQHSSATTAISQSYFDSSNNLADTSASDNYVPKQFNFHMLDSTSENDQFPNPQDRRF